jgi:hypothetical protein
MLPKAIADERNRGVTVSPGIHVPSLDARDFGLTVEPALNRDNLKIPHRDARQQRQGSGSTLCWVWAATVAERRAYQGRLLCRLILALYSSSLSSDAHGTGAYGGLHVPCHGILHIWHAVRISVF